MAKQVWCFLHHQDTLFFKVFSAKHFPNGNILDAPIHPKCSYAWWSILTACGVIEKGAIWRVGSGQMIDVWHHRWLPDLNHSKIISPNANNDVSRVYDLFLPGTRT